MHAISIFRCFSVAWFISYYPWPVFSADEAGQGALPPAFNLVWDQIEGVQIRPLPSGTAIQLTLDEKTAAALAAFTGKHLQQKIRFQINGHTTLQPTVQEKITGGMIQLQVQTLKEANQVLAYFYQARRVPRVNAALGAIAEEVKKQQQRLGDLTAQRKALRARGVSPLDEQMQELSREIEQLNALIQKITERYQQERAILNP